MSPTAAPWWRSAVIYQVYIRSFADGNGDGVGDIAGIRSRLQPAAAGRAKFGSGLRSSTDPTPHVMGQARV
jgi:hypothetical protein